MPLISDGIKLKKNDKSNGIATIVFIILGTNIKNYY